MTQIALNKALLPVKPKFWFHLLKLTQPRQTSTAEPEHGTALRGQWEGIQIYSKIKL